MRVRYGAGIEVVHDPVEIERRIGERCFGGFEPEQVAIHARDQNVALESRGAVKRALGDTRQPILRRVQPLDFGSDSGGAPIRQLAVVLVSAGDDGEVGVGFEITLDDLLANGRPLHRVRGAARLRLRFRSRRASP